MPFHKTGIHPKTETVTAQMTVDGIGKLPNQCFTYHITIIHAKVRIFIVSGQEYAFKKKYTSTFFYLTLRKVK
jgi:hypothetical protein